MRLGLGLGISNALAGGGSGGGPATALNISFATGVPVDEFGHTLQENQSPTYPYKKTLYEKGLYNNNISTNVSTVDWDNDLSGNWTIDFWSKIIDQGESTGKLFFNGQFYMQLGFNATFAFGNTSAIVSSSWQPKEVWRHYCVTKDNTGAGQMYINGVLIKEGNVGNTVTSSGQIIIGAGSVGGANTANQVIANFRLQHEVLDASAILAIFDAEKETYLPDYVIEKPDFYVANGGSDAGAGTIDDPYETVAKANSLASGSIVGFKRGDTWTGDDIEPANDNMRFIDYGDTALAKPIITGVTYGVNINKSSAFLCSFKNLNFKNSAGTYNCLVLIDTAGSYVEFENCDFNSTGSAFVSIGEVANVWFNNCTVVTASGTYAFYSSSLGIVGLEDSVVNSGANNGVYISGVGASATIRRNTITGNVAGIYLNNVVGVDVSYNIIKGMAVAGNRYGIHLDGTLLNDIHIFNNTMYLDGNSEDYNCYGLYGDSAITFAGACSFNSNIVFINNANIPYMVRIDMDFTANLSLDRNCYYDTIDSKTWYMNSTAYYTLSTWRTAVSDEAFSVNDDPDFEDTTDFKPSTTSPALNLSKVPDIKHINLIPLDKTTDVVLNTDEGLYPAEPRVAIPTLELIVNGNQSLTTGWDDIGTPTVNARSSTRYKTRLYSRKITADSGDGAKTTPAFSVVAGKTYRVSAWVWVVSGAMTFDSVSPLVFSMANAGTGAWELLTEDVVAVATGSVTGGVRFKSTSAGTEMYVDDVSVTELVAFDLDTASLKAVGADQRVFFNNYFNIDDSPVLIKFEMKFQPGSNLGFGRKKNILTSYYGGYAFYCASDMSLVMYESGPSANTILFRSAGSVLTVGTWHQVEVFIKTGTNSNFNIKLDGTTLPATQAGTNPVTNTTFRSFTHLIADLQYVDASNISEIRRIVVSRMWYAGTTYTKQTPNYASGSIIGGIKDVNDKLSPYPMIHRLDAGANQAQLIPNLLYNGDFSTQDLTGWSPTVEGSWEFVYEYDKHSGQIRNCVKFMDVLTGYLEQAEANKVVWTPNATYALSWDMMTGISGVSINVYAGTSFLGQLIKYDDNSFQEYFGRKTIQFTLGAGPYTDGLRLYSTTSGRSCSLANLELIKIS